MSGRHYEELWRQGVAELVSRLDAEHPEDRASAPKKFADWARLYVLYVQTLRKLCLAHDNLVQPQQRRCLQSMLEACLGRVLELRNYLAELNEGLDVLNLEEQLAALQLTPDRLELPVPAYFREARASRLAAQAEAVAAALAGQTAATVADPGTSYQTDAESLETETKAAVAESHDAAGPLPTSTAGDGRAVEPAAHQDTACKEDRAQLCQPQFQEQEAQQQREAAAVMVQAYIRGWLARRRVKHDCREELEFLGMQPRADHAFSMALQQRISAIHAERKDRQAARQRELDDALISAKAAIRQQDGFAIKEQMRDKLNDWFLKSRDPETGDYADLPEATKGGSRDIVQPMPPQQTPEEAAAAAAQASRDNKAASGSSSGRGQQPAAPKISMEFLEAVKEAVQQYMDVWEYYKEDDPTVNLLPTELQGLPQPKGSSASEICNAAMVTAEVRPVVVEEIRLEADEEMRRLIQSIKDMLKDGRAQRARKDSQTKGKAKDSGNGGKNSAAAGKSSGASAPTKGAKQAAGAAQINEPFKKKRKDLTAGRSIESLFSELAAGGLVEVPTPASLADYIGSDRLSQAEGPAAHLQDVQPSKAKSLGKASAGTAKPSTKSSKTSGGKGKAAGAVEDELREYPEASFAQIRQAVVASCVLPLGAHPALSKLQTPHTVLLYGPAGTGKSLLSMAAAYQAGAILFHLSPAATAGKFPGKQAALMVHMVFKAARAMAPAVILIEDADQVFMSDKTRAALLAPPGGEPPNRIRRALLAEVAALEAGDGVLVLCTSRQPQACVKRDERALMRFVQRYIQLPLPDYGTRLILLATFAEREGLQLSESAGLLAQLTEGFSSGQLHSFLGQLAQRLGSGKSAADATVAAAISAIHQHKHAAVPGSVLEEALELLPGFAPVGAEEAHELRVWTAKAHSPLPEDEPSKDVKKKK